MNDNDSQPIEKKSLLDRLPEHAGLCFVIVCFIIFLVWLLYGFRFETANLDYKDMGDAYGPLSTLFSGFAFACLILAIVLQRADLKVQNTELIQVGLSLAKQHKELLKQNSTLSLQRFENTFFSLLQTLTTIANCLHLKCPSTNIDFMGISSFEAAYIHINFYESNQTLKKSLGHVDIYSISKIDEIIRKRKDYISNLLSIHVSLAHVFSHYFSFLDTIIDFILKSELSSSEKNEYLDFVKAQIPPYALIILFYYNLKNDKDDTKKILEKVSTFSLLNLDLLASPLDVLLYDKFAFGSKKSKECSVKIFEEITGTGIDVKNLNVIHRKNLRLD